MPKDFLWNHHGFTSWLHTQDGETFTIEHVADVEPVLDLNKRFQSDNPRGLSVTREWKHVAEIPAIIVERWINEYGVDPTDGHHNDLLKRLLNSNEWRWLRSSEGMV